MKDTYGHEEGKGKDKGAVNFVLENGHGQEGF